jgi:hypothetical protein
MNGPDAATGLSPFEMAALRRAQGDGDREELASTKHDAVRSNGVSVGDKAV